jgi:GAF domain-containing protein
MTIFDGSHQEGHGDELPQTPEGSHATYGFGGASPAVLLQPLTAALLEAVTPADVVGAVVARGVEALGAEAGLVVLVSGDDREEPHLDIVGARGYSDEILSSWRRFPLSASLPLSDAVRGRIPLYWATRTELEARYPEMFQQGPTHPVKASVSLPLVARGRAFGGLHFSFPAEREAFDEADRAFLDELARQCSLALDRALLLKEMEDARARQEFLSRASTLLAESLDYQTTLESIARLAVPELCDWMTVDMIAPAEGSGGPAGAPILHLAVAAHVDPVEVEALREMRRRSPIDMTQAGQPPVAAILTGGTVLMPEITAEIVSASARNEEQHRHIERLAVRSLISVPLQTASSTSPIGAVTLVFTHASGRTFTPDTVSLAEELTRRAAVAVG